MRQDANERACLFQTILNNGKFTKYPVRFKGESNGNLSEDFTISIEDAICIALSKQDNYCRSRQCITSEEMVMQLLFYHYRSSRYIIWRSSYQYYSRGRYKYSCIAESCIAESCIAESCIAESCIAENMHRESIIMHDEKIPCLVKIYTSREEFMPR